MRAGIFQCAAGGLSQVDRLKRLTDILRYESLDLVVCPELFMSGYHVGDALPGLAEPRGGPFAVQMAEIARARGTAMVYGYPESQDGHVYNSAACIDGDGRVIANHRKLVLPPGFESKYFEAGDDLTLFELHGTRCAILICYDAEYPELMRAAAEAGAQIVIVPTALADNWSVVAHQVMSARAFENGIWLLYANHAGTENGISYLGASCIVTPEGRDLERAGIGEQLIVGDLDPGRVVAARTRLPYLKDVVQLRDKLGRAAPRSG